MAEQRPMIKENIMFDAYTWNKIGKGFFVKDCTLGFEDDRFGFLFVEDNHTRHPDEGWETRFLAVRMDLPIQDRFYMCRGTDMMSASLSSAWEPNQSEFVVADTLRHVWSYKPGEYKGVEEKIPFDSLGHQFGSAIMKIVRVGTTIYALGTPFRIYQRTDDQKWKEILDIPMPSAFFSKNVKRIVQTIDNSMLLDLAGFSGNDMYAVGDAGTVWHFDGARWVKIPFPSNLRLTTVACAGDGFVYITDIRGSIWQGRGTNWSLLCKLNRSRPFSDSAWFDGRFWCANDVGMYVLDGTKLVACDQSKLAPVPVAAAVHAHSIDVSPDGKRMLVCGGDGAALYDGTTWTILFSGIDFD